MVAEAVGCRPKRGLPRLDRGDRRAARPVEVRRASSADAAARATPGPWLDAARRHHDHRHLSEGRDAAGEARRGDGDDQRHRQGRRHDRAGHGDDARPSSSPTRRSPRPCCRRCSARACGGSFNAITVDSDTSTSDTLLLFATGAGGRRAAHRQSARPPPRPISATRSTSCSSISPTRWCATARGRGSSSRCGSRARCRRRSARRIALVDRQLAAGQDGDRRRGRQLGPHRHGGRQGRRAGRPRPPGDLVRRASASRSRASATRPIRRPPRRPYMKSPRDHRSSSISGSATAATRCGPATSPRNTSPSTATTGRERMRLVLVAACALVDADGRVLIAQRPGGQDDGRPLGIPRRQDRSTARRRRRR